jgi:hypothetical protein
LNALIAAQDALGLVPVQAGCGNHVQKHLATADVLALGEVRSEQRLHERILNALLIGQPDKPVCVQAVRCSLCSVEGEVNALCLADSLPM